MKRFLLAAVASLSLVTAAVTQPTVEWNIVAIVSAHPSEPAVYGILGEPAAFASKDECEHVLARITDVREDFERSEAEQHGVGTTIVWRCVTPGTDI